MKDHDMIESVNQVQDRSILPVPMQELLSGLDLFNNRGAFRDSQWHPPQENSDDCIDTILDSSDCQFFKIDEISYDSEFPRREAMENVLSVFEGSNYHFVYLLSGSEVGVDIYIGVARNCRVEKDRILTANTYGKILQDTFLGNFQGSKLIGLEKNDLENDIFSPLKKSRRGSLITGIPSINETSNGDNQDFQGIDRLINSMMGKEWRLLIVCEPVDAIEINETRKAVYNIYDQLHVASKLTVQLSENWGLSEADQKGGNDGGSEAKAKNVGESITKGRSSGGWSSSKQKSKGKSSTITKSYGSSWSKTKTTNKGGAESLTREIISKEVMELMKYVDEELLERLRLGQSKGLFKTVAYALADNREDHERLARTVKAIFQGDSSTFSPLRISTFPEFKKGSEAEELKNRMLCKFQTWTTAISHYCDIPLLYGHPVTKDGDMGLATYLTGQEISLIAGLPTREVPGVQIIEGVDFGLNPALNGCANEACATSDQIQLGYILHRGQKLSAKKICLAKKDLMKHVFVAGVTGSGKTTTCQKLLLESSLPFMVIEPAKTEYRALVGKVAGLKVFTLGNEGLVPFRFNPFELTPDESITSHIDMLKASFTAAFPMEQAMPYMLEEAIYLIYKWYGWDTSGSKKAKKSNTLCPDGGLDPWSDSVCGRYWPIMSDLLKALTQVVDDKGFDARLASDYKASLISRLKNLTIGPKGQMLNCRRSVNFAELLESKVIFEMDDLKDPQDKSLMMGLILSRMCEVLKNKHMRFSEEQPEGVFQHLTLIEEAHRLLEKTEPGDGGSKKHAISMFTDMLAEVRKYGEGLIIVDQIPNKLAPEVLKNTNTKIIHKLFARDDREAVGDTMGMDDDQKDWLSRLRIGEVVVFSGDWQKPVHAMIECATSTTEESVFQQEKIVRIMGENLRIDDQWIYFPQLGEAGIKFEKIELLEAYSKLRDNIIRECQVTLNEKDKLEYISAKRQALSSIIMGEEYSAIVNYPQIAEVFCVDLMMLSSDAAIRSKEESSNDSDVLLGFLECLFENDLNCFQKWSERKRNARNLQLLIRRM